LPAAQIGLCPVQLADFAVRTANDRKSSVNAIMAEIWAIDKDQPATSVRTMDEIIDQSASERRFQTLLEALLFQVTTTDWRAYAAAVVTLTIVAFVAAMIPARRAARVDPMVALRQE
jgi:ribosomal protein S3AE